MPRQQAFVVQNNFIQGFLSDNTFLNFPNNACVEADNCIFDENGRVTRRNGFDFEANKGTNNVEPANLVTTSFTWTEANGSATSNFLVKQIGSTLYFYDLSFSVISQGLHGDTIDLGTYDITGSSDIGAQACQYAQGFGYLFVTHPQCDPFYITYDGSNITGSVITVQIRDLIGLADSLEIDERPTATVASLSTEHKYNLYNQGWYYDSAGYLTSWDTARADMPSNADIWWFYRDSSYAFDTSLIASRTLGNTPAPKGYYVLDAFSEDRSTASSISGISIVSTDPQRPSTCAFFAGRVWYAGTESQGFTNKIFFSQVLEEIGQASKCYQKNDPTAEDANDLLATDGGYIVIQGCGTVLAMREMQHSLIVFATNGIWAIAGSSGTGFLATDFAVAKISSVPCTNSSSIVDVDGSYFFWNDEGIWRIHSGSTAQTQNKYENLNTLPSQQLFTIESVTNHKIRTYLNDEIPAICHKQTVGAYNPANQVVQWLFRTTEPSTPDEISNYDKILNYNLLSKAFYIWTVDNSNVALRAPFVFKGYAGNATVLNVIDGSSNNVIDASSNQVIAYDLTGSADLPQNKYIVSYVDGSSDTQFTIAATTNTLYLDWSRYDSAGVDFSSYFITGYMLPGDGMRFYQPNYIQLFLEQETGAGGYIQGIFDWTSATDSNRWSGLQPVYNSTLTNRVANFRRLKIRGKGKSIQLRVESETNKPFTIVGWSMKVIGNADL